MLPRSLHAFVLTILLCGQVFAQDAPVAPIDRSATGGAQTLDDIMARQNAQRIDDSFRSNALGDPDGAAPAEGHLGTLGGQSDAEIWRALRYDKADVIASNQGPAADVLIQDGGMTWLEFRRGPLATYGAWLLAGTLALLALFFLLRGRIRLEGEWSGIKILRFTSVERFAHWLLAGSFLLLGATGLISLFGRKILIPAFGKESFASLAAVSKVIHDNVSWAFMAGLLMIILLWTLQNIPNRHDLVWLAKGGGMFGKGVHPPARKFNAGQKMIFWGVVIFGLSISVSGLSLLFPFEMPLFAKSFAFLNWTGLPELTGYGTLPETMPPHQEMQLAQAWHAIVAFLFIAMIFAHIYIGTIGMEGAFEAMGEGEVDAEWAREHHGLWVEETTARERRDSVVTPAE